MRLEMFDKVLLKTGETAFIVEIFDDGAAYEMDINKKDGKTVTDTVWPDQIEKKLRSHQSKTLGGFLMPIFKERLYELHHKR